MSLTRVNARPGWRFLTEADKDAIREALKSMSQQKVARQLGVSQSTVQRVAKEYMAKNRDSDLTNAA